jgi:aerobic-type carbon monoxide dehydrogenase small subunit (CoxS/CutS family)
VRIGLTVNGEPQQWDVEVDELLLDALRRNGYKGAKHVCDSGECGACAVIINGLAVDTCIQIAPQADGADIVTVEGLEENDVLHPVQEAFASNGAVQCGFCIPGMVVTAANYLNENPQPTLDDIRHVLVGNLCRCTGYKKPIEAVLTAAQKIGEAP